MSVRFALPAAMAVFLLAVHMGSAEPDVASADPERGTDCGGAGQAPCGWVNPIIDLVFPEKKDCGTGLVLGEEASPQDCMTPPRDGEPVKVEGTLRWYWDVSYEGTYPADPSEPIEVSFAPTSSDPEWIEFSIEPATFVIDNTVLFDPNNFETVEKADGTMAVFYWFERPITVTFERTGAPSDDDWKTIQNKDGVQPVFIKAKSTASGSQIKEAFGIELFQFHVANDPELAGEMVEEQAPSPGILLAFAAVGLAAVAAARRRR